ncbi:PAB-dependent polyA-specific ribonuclease subunit PAN3 [Hondaea fermentalgiana]|uniref:PAB-dependent polyA-specific ribonuclease subunit PAN3 n=1 Tax=Hondaea fermentalgiana TaxID=2315210 RepID=A0A2R5GL00_9STRA|nr:PAB-dependent polyA-specific ribonuclease subunit PAN3 [Hondaea fermentalgiana]|eukprot:GBG31582.1 PAB-dependent polyA-specific ribonuclease subunit PAN3 [Hondaea fermentalgiana]
MSPDLRSYFAHSLKLTMKRLPLSDARNKEVPKWFNLVNPLDDPGKTRGAAGSCGYPTSVFKVVNRRDGHVYALRRIDNMRNVQALEQCCELAVGLWKRVRHANVVPLRQAFVHQRAVFLVHDYWPGAQTLHDYVNARSMSNALPENILWSLAVQLLSALRATHEQKVSFRGGISPHTVLLTGRNRVRVACSGLMHVVEGPFSDTEEKHVLEDVQAVSKLMLMLACMSTQVKDSWQDAVDFVSSRYSKEFTTMVALPLHKSCTVYDMLGLCSRGLLSELDEMYSHSDALEEQLCKQLETSRLNRLLFKINLVTERPEYGKSESASWAETGDRYIIKLFRDYVFHQTTDDGKPWLDIGHIVTCLQKLDVGSMEKILLNSRDGRSILMVTYADVRKCIDEAFVELHEAHRSSQYFQLKMAGGPPKPAQGFAAAQAAAVGGMPGRRGPMMHPGHMTYAHQAGAGSGNPYAAAAAAGHAAANPYAHHQMY